MIDVPALFDLVALCALFFAFCAGFNKGGQR